MKTFRNIMIILMILGVMSLAINTVFGAETILYLKTHELPNNAGIYYTFDFASYLTNIETAVTDVSIFNFVAPTSPETFDVLGYLAYSANLWILMINMIGYPFRVALYIIRLILVLLGCNQDYTNPQNGFAWLFQLIANFKQIPYIGQ